ncbi:MFS transporter, ACS family, pantothenate transporter, partial [Phenoliferia sp. Uapishka_3]
MGLLLKIRTIVWGPPAETKAERSLIVKVDFFVMTFVCLMYFSNYLDRANLANAYVSGMKESLGMVGKDLNNVNSLFTVGYTVGMLPQNLLLHKFSPRFVMATNCMIWGGLTMCTAAATSTTHLMVIRFFQGIAESSTFVGTHYLLGCWYLESELGKRGAIFSSAAQVATIFSGVLQASIYKNLNGHAGLAGFQWLFIICGLITIPIAAFGVIFFPDTPESCSSRFLNPEERELAVTRLPPKQETKLDMTVFKRVFGRWRWYLLCLIWIVGGELESVGSNSLMALWMKAQPKINGQARWTVSNYNYYPTGTTCIAIAALLITAMWTDYTRKRWPLIFFKASDAPRWRKGMPVSKAYVDALRDRIRSLESELNELKDALQEKVGNSLSGYEPHIQPSHKDDDADSLAASLGTRLRIDASGQTRLFGATSPFLEARNIDQIPAFGNLHHISRSSINPSMIVYDPPSPATRLQDRILPFSIPSEEHNIYLSTALRFGLNFCSLVEADLSIFPEFCVVVLMTYLTRKFQEANPSNIEEVNRTRATFTDAAKLRLCTYEFESPTLATIRTALVLAGVLNAAGDDRQAWLYLGKPPCPFLVNEQNLLTRTNRNRDSDESGHWPSGGARTSGSKCTAAAERILQLMRQYDKIYGVERTPQTAMMTTYVAGTVFGLCAKNSSDQAAATKLMEVVKLLTKMNETWSSAGKCANILRDNMVKIRILYTRNAAHKSLSQDQTSSSKADAGADRTPQYELFNASAQRVSALRGEDTPQDWLTDPLWLRPSEGGDWSFGLGDSEENDGGRNIGLGYTEYEQ